MSKKKVKNDRMDILLAIGFPILIIYSFAIIINIIAGISDSKPIYGYKNYKCEEPLSRYEYIFPFYRLGCWLGEIPEDKTCNKTSEN